MLLKKNSLKIIVFIIASFFALYSKSSLSIIILIGTQIALWVNDVMAQKAVIESLANTTIEKVTEAHTQVNQANETLESLIRSIPSALAYINQKGEFEVTNENFDYLIDPSHKNVFDASIDTPIRKVLLDAFLGEKQFIRQLNYRDVDYQILSVPFFGEKNRYNGCMIIFQDVTRVVEGEKIQKRFIADASHELRTPITAIKGMIEILNRPGFDDDATRVEFLKQIEKENGRMDKIVEDLLFQSKLKANQVYIEKAFFNVKQFLEGVLYDKRQEIQNANISVHVNCSDSLQVYADQFRLSQVFVNLINNAINYTKDGDITITCRKEDRKVIIQFADNGQGIAPDLLPHIFERFVRGDSARSRDTGGSGLGLAISKSILEAHGGTLEASSELGVGTTFTLTLHH